MPLAPGIPQCHHVRTHGVRCGSPAMRGRNLCYFHARVSAKPNPRPQGMPCLEDGNAIQVGIGEIIRRVLCYDIDYKAAYCLLHAYKLALWNLKNLREPDAWHREMVTVDPASDPENAGTFTEPLTYTQIDEIENPQPEIAQEAEAESDDEETDFKKFLLSHLVDPHDAASDRRSEAQHRVLHSEQGERSEAVTNGGNTTAESEGRHYLAQGVSPGKAAMNEPSPAGTAHTQSSRADSSTDPTLSSRAKGAATTNELSSRAEHVSAESRDHALDFDSAPQRGATLGKPETGNGKPIQRITVPKELEDLIKAEAEEEKFLRAAAALFNQTKTG